MSGENHIGGRFAFTGIRVNVTAQQSVRLAGHKRAAVFSLADGLVTGGKIADECGAYHGVPCTGRQRRPKILADLDGQRQRGLRSALEQQVRAERDLCARQVNDAVFCRGRCKLPLFVKFIVIGQVCFRHDAQHTPVLAHSRAVIQLTAVRKRQPQNKKKRQPGGIPQDVSQCVPRALLQHRLKKQVPAGIACDAKLRQACDFRTGGGCAAQHLDDLPGIVGAVRHADAGGKRCCLYKSILHKRSLT